MGKRHYGKPSRDIPQLAMVDHPANHARHWHAIMLNRVQTRLVMPVPFDIAAEQHVPAILGSINVIAAELDR